MINKSFHNVLKGVSILPALLVVPAMADPMVGFVDGYVTDVTNQLYNVLKVQNATGFNIGAITIGAVTDSTPIYGDSLRYGVTSRDDAAQYVKMENVSMPTGLNDIYLNMPVKHPGSDYGLSANEVSAIQNRVGGTVVLDDNGVAVLYKPTVGGAGALLNSMVDEGTLGGRSWFLGATGSAITNNSLQDGYLYTDSNFVVDGKYGNMTTTFIETYRASVLSILDDLADVSGMDKSYVAERIATKLGSIIKDAGVNTELDAQAAGEKMLEDAFGVTADKIAEKWQSGELKSALNAYLTQLERGLADLDTTNTLNLNVGNVAVNSKTNVTVKNTVNLTSSAVTIDGANVVVDNGATLGITGADIQIVNGAVVTNNGNLNMTGGSALTIGTGSILNIGESKISQNVITLNGTMNAVLNETDGNDAQYTASTFGGNGTLNASFAGAGEYQIFSTDTTVNFDDSQIVNSVYDVTGLDGANGRYTVSVKSAAKIASDNNLSAEAAATVGGLAGSSSNALNDLSVLMQEKLAENTAEARQEIEQATSAINPETESVAQSVSNSVQTTVVNLASARMVAPAAGRSAGDVDLKAGGVWAQGLYNKSKLNDSFNGYTRGVAVGADGIINNDITVGAGYAFNHSDITSNSRNTEIDSNTVFVYGQYKPAEWYVNAILNYTWSEYSEDGTAMGMPVTGEYNADSFGAAVTGGYDFACGVTPELGLRYMYVNGDSYTDSLGINKEFDSTNYLTGTLGARYGFNVMATETTLLRPELRYAIKYDLVSDASYATVAMPGVAAYSVDGNRLERFGNEFGIGLTMRYRTMDLSLTYDIDVRKDYTSQTGMLKFRYNF